MFRLLIVIVLTLLVLAPATSALGQQELPSAPSAVRQQQNQASVPAAPPPASAQQTPKPAPVPEVPAPPPAAPESQDTSKPAAEGGNAESQPQNSNDSGEAGITFVKRVDEVNVIFTVTDKHGKFVKDLEKTDFRILDNNVAPKQIDAFSRETNLPLRIGLLIDASNSIRDRFKFEQDASIEFLNQVVRPKSDRAFVLGFDTTAEVTADFTDSAEELSKGVRMLRPGGGTALYD
ncbi:MAG: VWA domain-containing protein, partial [Terriglobales bacterium]